MTEIKTFLEKVRQNALTNFDSSVGVIPLIAGHGTVLNPVSRGSRWRCKPTRSQKMSTTVHAQWDLNGGKCGLCGDNYADGMPRMHELGRLYKQGDIVPLDASGNRRWKLESGKTGEHLVRVQLPRDLTCAHCSLQWTGNNWGWCGDGTGALGCGPQETFRTCSDISILDSSDVRLYEGFDYCSRASRSLNSISADDEIPESDVEEQD